ncbi:MAG: hypothetical protein K1W23_11795 [Lachnospiraceae bacterium]|jgi:hypothetical protein
MKSAADEILKAIKYAVERQKVNCDRTYRSVIKRIDKKGYVIIDRTGSERTVKCCIPGIEFRVGQSVWVKEPMGKLNDIHICGVV